MRTLSTLILLAFACVARAAHPLSGCSAGTAVQNTNVERDQGSCGYGLPSSASWTTASVAVVSEDFYGNGQRCGQCFEIVGPKGSTIVTVVSYCPRDSDTRCSNPNKAHFSLSSAAFNQVANATTDFLINDLGYRQVSCPVSGDVSVAFPNTPNAGYLPILPFNARIAVSTVEVKGSSWANYEMATRDTNSGRFTWNKRTSNQLSGSFSLRLTANTGEKLVTVVSSYSSTHNSDKQFSDVPEVTADCRLGVASPVIFNSAVASPLGDNWVDDYSFLLISKIIDPTDNSLKATMGGNGAVQFTRSGGFDPVYYTSLTFTAKASVNGYDKLRVYLGTDTSKAVSVGPLTAEYATYTVSFAEFSGVQSSVVIQNNDGNTVDVWFNYVSLIRNADVPADNAPLPTTGLVTYTTTANPPGTIGNSQNNPIDGSDSENSGAASTTATVAVALLVVFACLM